MSQAALVAKCASYDEDAQCVECEAGFVLFRGGCSPLSANKIIAFCEAQAGDNSCARCQKGFLPSFDQRACLPLAPAANCLSYQPIRCLRCRENYFLNPKLHQTLLAGQILQSQQQEQIFWLIASGLTGSTSVCQDIDAQAKANCVELKSFEECARCSPGYYLTDDLRCKAYPRPRIDNCRVYRTVTACQTCESGYIEKNGLCAALAEEVPNCVRYDPSASQAVCLQCDTAFVLLGPKQCQKRQIIIQKCQTYAISMEQCVACEPGLQTTGDKMRCLPAVANCRDYFKSDLRNDQLFCETCATGYYLKYATQSCEKGTVPYCLVYLANSNSCQACENKYYINFSRTCTRHVLTKGCALYDQTVPNLCAKCEGNAMMLFQRSTCKQFAQDNCASFSSDYLCTLCADKYDLNAAGKCNPIENNPNCRTSALGVCSACFHEFKLVGGVCVDISITQNLYCEPLASDGSLADVSLPCQVCKPGTMFFNHTSNYMCEEVWRAVQMTVPLVSKCQLYSAVGG